MIFKVGDRVRVRPDLIVGNFYDSGCHFVSDMSKYIGKVGIITKNPYLDRVLLDIDKEHWCWTPSMLELYVEPAETPKPKFKIGDKVVPINKSTGSVSIHMVRSRMEENHMKYFIIRGFCGNVIEAGYPNRSYWNFLESDLIPYKEFPKKLKAEGTPKNLAPTNKTYTEGDKTFIVSGKATICIIKFNGHKFKGVAKCSPEDIFAELIGKTIAEARAEQEKFKWIEKNPNEGWIYEARKLKQESKIINAVKIVRNHTGWGLRESKEYVDNVL